MNDVKRIDIAEFRRLGLLQEINRRLLHPCGLALEVIVEDDGTERFGGVWDYRDDPEGIVYVPGTIDPALITRVDEMIDAHADARIVLLGRIVQEPDR